MPSGFMVIAKPRSVVADRLRMVLAGANCEVLESSDRYFRFRHGTYLTQTATLFPKVGSLWLEDEGNDTAVRYEVSATAFIQVWFTIMGVLLCWLIVPAIMAHRIIVYHPKRFVENLLAGI